MEMHALSLRASVSDDPAAEPPVAVVVKGAVGKGATLTGTQDEVEMHHCFGTYHLVEGLLHNGHAFYIMPLEVSRI